MVTIPNQSSVPKDSWSSTKPSSCYSRAVDVCEEVVKFTWLVRGHSAYLTDRYSERIESAAELPSRVNQRAI